MPIVLSKPTFSRLQKGKSLAFGLVGAWTFYEGSGPTLNDISDGHNAYNGTLAGTTGVPTWQGGPDGYSLNFTAANSQYIPLPTATQTDYAFSNTTFTVFFRAINSSVGLETVLSVDGTAANNSGWYCGYNTNTAQMQTRGVGGAAASLNITASLAAHDIAFVATTNTATAASNTITGYVDGAFVGSASGTTITYVAPAMAGAIGVRGVTGSASFFNNKISCVMVWNRALSAAEIAALSFDPYTALRHNWSRQLFKASPSAVIKSRTKLSFPRIRRDKQSLSSGLVGAWQFYEGSGTTANDISESGHIAYNGAFTNAPSWQGGPDGSSINFAGTNSYILLPAATQTAYSFANSYATVFARAQLNAAGGLLMACDGINGSGGWFLSGGTPSLQIKAVVSTPCVVTANTQPDGKYHDIVAVFHPDTVTAANNTAAIYIDGAFSSNTNTTVSPGTYVGPAFAATIGARGGGSTGYFTGNMSCIYLWNRALSADEIARLSFDPFALSRPYRSRQLFKASAFSISSAKTKMMVPRLQRGHNLARGLTGAWISAEGSGPTLFDWSENGFPASPTATAATWTGGVDGSALNFTGTQRYQTAVRAPPLKGMTILQTLSASSSTTGVSFSQYSATNNAWQFFAGGGTYVFQVANGVPTIGRQTGVVSGLNVEQTVVCVWDGTNTNAGIKIYVNGVRVDSVDAGSGVFTGVSATPQAIMISDRGDLLFPWNGKISNSMLWNRALSADEVAAVTLDPYDMFRPNRNRQLFKAGLPSVSFRRVNMPMLGM